MSTLDILQAAYVAKCHPDTLRKMAKAGDVPATKIGRAWVFPEALLHGWIEKRARADRASRAAAISDEQLAAAAAKLGSAMPKMAPITAAPKQRKPLSYYAGKRKAALLARTPVWADRDAIMAIYAECERLTYETGFAYNVDHVVPLQGELVSGLHVENNLQILLAIQNAIKGNRFEVL